MLPFSSYHHWSYSGERLYSTVCVLDYLVQKVSWTRVGIHLHIYIQNSKLLILKYWISLINFQSEENHKNLHWNMMLYFMNYTSPPLPYTGGPRVNRSAKCRMRPSQPDSSTTVTCSRPPGAIHIIPRPEGPLTAPWPGLPTDRTAKAAGLRPPYPNINTPRSVRVLRIRHQLGPQMQ